MKEGIASGFGEWSFSLHNDEDGFVLRDCINIGGFGGTKEEFGGAIIGDKFLIGKRFDTGSLVIRNYAMAGVGFGAFNTSDYFILSSPFILSTVFGGGMELQYSQKLAFVIEFGGSQDFIVGDKRESFLSYQSISPILILGFRSYF